MENLSEINFYLEAARMCVREKDKIALVCVNKLEEFENKILIKYCSTFGECKELLVEKEVFFNNLKNIM